MYRLDGVICSVCVSGSRGTRSCPHFSGRKTRRAVRGNDPKCCSARLFLRFPHTHCSGIQDSTLFFENLQNQDVCYVMESCHSYSSVFVFFWKGHTDELWGLDVHPTTEQFVTCAQDKQVYLWDTSSHLPLWSKAIEVNVNIWQRFVCTCFACPESHRFVIQYNWTF